MRPQPGLRIVRSPLSPGDVHRSAVLHLTTPVRTAFDVARERGWETAVAGIDAMLHARLVTKEEVAAFVLARKGWRRGSQVMQVLVLSDGRAESPQESRLRLVLVTGGLPRPHVQFEVRDLRFAAADLYDPRKVVGTVMRALRTR